MRLYFFNNLYISSMQHGIQGIHSLTEIFVRYGLGSAEAATAMAWATNHKTVIVTCGGYASTLQEVFDRLSAIAADWREEDGQPCLPFAKFHEEEQALGGALTSVAVVVPATAYFDRDRKADEIALRKRAADAGYLSTFDASGDRERFSPAERLALLCGSFPLAH